AMAPRRIAGFAASVLFDLLIGQTDSESCGLQGLRHRSGAIRWQTSKCHLVPRQDEIRPLPGVAQHLLRWVGAVCRTHTVSNRLCDVLWPGVWFERCDYKNDPGQWRCERLVGQVRHFSETIR